MKAVVVIPALDEAATVGAVLAAIPEGAASAVVVVDGGSSDHTAETARAHGAVVVVERRRGYGRACLTGVEQAERLGADVIAFLDGGFTADPRDLPAVLAPLRGGIADLVLGSRELGVREAGALRRRQRLGNRLATELIHLLTGFRYTDLGSLRAIRLTSLRALELQELGHGWPVEMQIKAVRRGLRVTEVPMRARRRPAGRSKVSGSVRGSVRAGGRILRVVWREGR